MKVIHKLSSIPRRCLDRKTKIRGAQFISLKLYGGVMAAIKHQIPFHLLIQTRMIYRCYRCGLYAIKCILCYYATGYAFYAMLPLIKIWFAPNIIARFSHQTSRWSPSCWSMNITAMFHSCFPSRASRWRANRSKTIRCIRSSFSLPRLVDTNGRFVCSWRTYETTVRHEHKEKSRSPSDSTSDLNWHRSWTRALQNTFNEYRTGTLIRTGDIK